MSEAARVAAAIMTLSIPDQIRLAADLLDEAATLENDPGKQLHATSTAHRILDRVSTELGAALCLHYKDVCPGASQATPLRPPGAPGRRL